MKYMWCVFGVCGCLLSSVTLSFAEEKDGKVTTYYPDGTTVYEEKNFTNGVLSGEYIKYYENGNQELVGNYVNDKEDGDFYYYDTEGRLIKKAVFKNGYVEGIAEEYFEDGSIKTETHYKESVLNGSFKVYDADGKVLVDANYKDGVLDGKYNGIGSYTEGLILPIRASSDPLFNGSDEEYKKYVIKWVNSVVALGVRIERIGGPANYRAGEIFERCLSSDEGYYRNHDRCDDNIWQAKEDIYAALSYEYRVEINYNKPVEFPQPLNLNGNFSGGKFTGTLQYVHSFYMAKPRVSKVQFKDDVPQTFDGCLNKVFTRNMQKIEKYMHCARTEYSSFTRSGLLCGKGTIKDGQLDGDFENISRGSGSVLNFVKGRLDNGKFTGSFLECDNSENDGKRTFYTYKNGILDGPTFDYEQSHFRGYAGMIVNKYAVMDKGRRVPDKNLTQKQVSDDEGLLKFIHNKILLKGNLSYYDYGKGKYVSLNGGGQSGGQSGGQKQNQVRTQGSRGNAVPQNLGSNVRVLTPEEAEAYQRQMRQQQNRYPQQGYPQPQQQQNDLQQLINGVGQVMKMFER